MKFKAYLLICCFALLVANTGQAQGQWVKLRKAGKLLTYGKVNSSISKLNEVLEGDSTNSTANYELGKIYLLNKEDYPKSIEHLTISINNFGKIKDTIFMAYSYLGDANKLTGEYEKAISNYQYFEKHGVKKSEKGDAIRAEIANKINECQIAHSIVSEKSFNILRIINLGEDVNSDLSEYCSVYFPNSNQLMYTARYQDNKKERKFLDLKYYESGYSMNNQLDDRNPKPIKINSKRLDRIHFSVVSKTISGDTILFYKDNNLWITNRDGDEIAEPIILPENINRSYYQPHGIFSPDNKTFIFSSSDKDIQLDLFVSTIDENGVWSAAKLLNSKINTSYKEDAPFFSKDGQTLYFSSNRSGGFGKYDIYKSKWSGTDWGEPINMGIPMNSSGEDIFFTFNDDEETGFLSSNRGGGEGSMDIYMFTYQPYPTFDCDLYVDQFKSDKNISTIISNSKPIVNEVLNFNTGESTFDNAEIKSVFWRVDGEILKMDLQQLNHMFTTEGNHLVEAQIYAYNEEDKEYIMQCTSIEVNLNKQDVLFLDIVSDRMVPQNQLLEMNTNVMNLSDSKQAEYEWYVDGSLVQKSDSVMKYTFKDTGIYMVSVKSKIINAIGNLENEIEGFKNIYVHDKNAALDKEYYEPFLELIENFDPNTGRINALKAEVYNVPNDRIVFYDWYINNQLIKENSASLLVDDSFKPMDVIKVVAKFMTPEYEVDFTLEATKVLIDYPTSPNLFLADKIDPNTGAIATMHANLFNLPKGKDVKYQWYVNGELIDGVDNDLLKYNFQPLDVVKVVGIVMNSVGEEEFTLTANDTIGKNLNLDLANKFDPNTGVVSTMHANMFNLPKGREVIYEWYVNGELISGVHADLLKYNFQPLDIVKVVGKVMNKMGEEEFLLEAFETVANEPNIALAGDVDSETGLISALKANLKNVPEGKEVVYEWYVNGELVQGVHSDLLKYNFQPMDVVKVIGRIMSKQGEEEFVLEAIETVVADPNLDLANKVDPNTGVVSTMHANMFNVPKGSDVVYEWYVNGELVAGVHTDLLKYNFKPLDVVKVIGRIMSKQGEEEFVLEAFETVVADPNLNLANAVDPNSGAITSVHANMFNVPKGRDIKYEWYVNGKLVTGVHSDLLKYNFKPLDVVKVIGRIMSKQGEEEFVLEAMQTITNPDLNLAHKIDPNSGEIEEVHANLFNVPKGKNVKYEWYVNGKLIEGANVDLLKYNFKPMDVVKVIGRIMNQMGEEEFVLESSMVLRVTTDLVPVQFAFDKYILSIEAKEIINENIQILTANSKLKIKIEGHTDSIGASNYNMWLSRKRAYAVYDYLKANGIGDDQIVNVKPNGESKPKESNSQLAGRQINRRVDFALVP